MNFMISLLITLLLVAVVVYIVYLILGMISLPDPIKKIIYLVVGLIVILWLLQYFGLLSGVALERTNMETKHALKTKAGIQQKKIEKLEAQLDVEPKSATGESTKESLRMLISILVGMGVTYLYQRYPVLGQLQPDQLVFVTILTSLIVRGVDKFIYQVNKNKGEVATPVGIDGTAVALASLFSRKKTQPVQADENKK